MQIAKADQEAILAAVDNNGPGVIAATRKNDAGAACLYYIAGLDAASIENKLTAAELNTQIRMKAFVKKEGLIGPLGYTIPKDKKSECTFNPDSLAD